MSLEGTHSKVGVVGEVSDTSYGKDEQVLTDVISEETFTRWYDQREFARNIRNGQSYFNGPPSEQPPEKHTPSKLLQCHRKSYYQHYNAPKETEGAKGIFWFGEQFETEVAVPFLRNLVTDDHFVRNSIWIDIEPTVNDEEIRIRGETDPVVVDRDSNPVLLTEIKTTSSVEYLDSPKLHHKAQVHTYQHGLAKKFDCKPVDAVILYGERESFDIKSFHVEFDPKFWKSVTEWAATQSEYRREESLPPAAPEQEWECQYCPYQGRCGVNQDEPAAGDTPPKGLIPQTEYPKSQLETYLQGHEGAKLTPTAATQHPDLADSFPVYDWHCECCDLTIPFEAVDWDGNPDCLPQCPACRGAGRPADLHDPSVDDQWPQALAQTANNRGDSG